MRYAIQFQKRLTVLLIGVMLAAAACEFNPMEPAGEATTAPEATTSPTLAAPEATAESPGASTQPVPLAPLRLWVPPEIGARTEAGSQELLSQIRAYETGRNSDDVVVEQKPIEGAGGVINYLQTGRTVAPDIMPDIVAVPTSLLSDTRVRDLFYPLGGLIDPGLIEEVYPAPASQAMRDGQILGYPFATAGLTHLIYNPGVITGTIPMSWTQLISETNHTLVFPADSREGAMLGLQFYLAEGGELADSAGVVTLQAEPLSRALATIGASKDNLLQSHQLKTLDEAWQYHQLGLSDFMWTRSDHLLSRQGIDLSLIDSQGYTAVPGVDGPLVPHTTSWAWVITTDDPARQVLAAELILYLTRPENLASWTTRSQILPANRRAMELLAEQNPYMLFAHEQSERAEPMPISEASRLMDVLGDAVFQVLTTDTSPLSIAEQAVQSLRQ